MVERQDIGGVLDPRGACPFIRHPRVPSQVRILTWCMSTLDLDISYDVAW